MKSIPVLVFLSLAASCMAELPPPLASVANKQKEAAKAIFDERVNEVIKIQDYNGSWRLLPKADE